MNMNVNVNVNMKVNVNVNVNMNDIVLDYCNYSYMNGVLAL